MAERIPVREVQGLEQSSGIVDLFEIELSRKLRTQSA